MVHKRSQYPGRKASGFSVLEMMIVLTIAGILSAIAIPQMIASRRVTRSVAVTREIITQLRLARQLAISRRGAYTFVYDDVAKDLRVIGPIPIGTVAFADPAYPNNLGSSTLAVSALNQQGLYGQDIKYGIPVLTPAVTHWRPGRRRKSDTPGCQQAVHYLSAGRLGNRCNWKSEE